MPKILSLLRRPDKHVLGGGDRLIWAPSFPLSLNAPGFWDPAHYFNYEVRPLFTWSLLDDKGSEIPLQWNSRDWDPARLTQTFVANIPGGRLTAIESKSILQEDVATCEVILRIHGQHKFRVHFLAWTAQKTSPLTGLPRVTDALYRDGCFSFVRHLMLHESQPASIGVGFALSSKPRSYAMQMSEGPVPPPQWNLTPFEEKFRKDRLPEFPASCDTSGEGTLFLALHKDLTLSAGKEATITAGMAFSPAAEGSQRHCAAAVKLASPTALSALAWNEYFLDVPQFNCSDEFLHRYYWYRWFGLRVHSLEASEGNYRHPAVCSGTGVNRVPTSQSSAAHILENRWHHNPEKARGSLFTFLEHQREDGSIPETVGVFSTTGEALAPWGRAVLDLHAVHPSPQLLRGAYEGLSRYSRHLDRTLDSEASGLYDERRSPQSPTAEDGGAARWKGVDATVSVYELKRSLAVIARELGKHGEAELWEIEADRIRNAVRNMMWDGDVMMFFDVNAADKTRGKRKTATSFVPYATDIVGTEHLAGLKTHLFNSGEFWSMFPVPTVSMDDGTFSATPDLDGRRIDEPWNGRVWPMINSRVVDALATCALTFDDNTLRQKTADFVTRFIRMMFLWSDPKRPSSCEHYNPVTGYPSLYRGIDDLESSWVVDHIIKYVCGIRPAGDTVIIDPFPFGLASASIEDVRVRGQVLRVDIKHKAYTVWLDGSRFITSQIGKSTVVPLQDVTPSKPARKRRA
jgi:hypothetical protein